MAISLNTFLATLPNPFSAAPNAAGLEPLAVVSGYAFGTEKASRPFGDGSAYPSVFRVKFQRNGLVIVKSASGMNADALVILFTVGNEAGKSASGFLRPDFFPCDELLCPCKIFNALFTPENNSPFPRLQGVCLRIACAMVMSVLIKMEFGNAFINGEDISDQTSAQCHTGFNGCKLFISSIPDLIENGKSLPAGRTGMGKHFEHFRMAGKPFSEAFVPEFLLGEWLAVFNVAEELVQIAQLRNLRGLDQFMYSVNSKRAGGKTGAQSFPGIFGNE